MTDYFENRHWVITFASPENNGKTNVQERKPYSFTHLNFYLRCQLKSDYRDMGLRRDPSTLSLLQTHVHQETVSSFRNSEPITH